MAVGLWGRVSWVCFVRYMFLRRMDKFVDEGFVVLGSYIEVKGLGLAGQGHQYTKLPEGLRNLEPERISSEPKPQGLVQPKPAMQVELASDVDTALQQAEKWMSFIIWSCFFWASGFGSVNAFGRE